MNSIRKYIIAFTLSWQNTLEYRFDFILGRLRTVMALLLFYYVWHSLTYTTQRFAGYTAPELFTYVFLGVGVLRSTIFGAQTRRIAQEINDGAFSHYLTKPLNHFWFMFFQELAERTVYGIVSIIEVVIVVFFLQVPFFWQDNIKILLIFLASCACSLVLYFVLSYSVSLIAFWSRESLGPRFLYEWFLEFASGAYFPLDIFAKIFFSALQFLPFMYLVYLPLRIYLGKVEFTEALQGVGIQIVWIMISGLLAYGVWVRGLRKYTGEGM